DRPRRQCACGGDDLGKLLADELLAARPDTEGVTARDELCAHTVPFPFNLPLLRCTELRKVRVERVRETKRIRTVHARLRIRRLFPAHTLPEGGRRAPVAGEGLRDISGSDTRKLRERAMHELASDAHPERTGQELSEHQPAVAIELRPALSQP